MAARRLGQLLFAQCVPGRTVPLARRPGAGCLQPTGMDAAQRRRTLDAIRQLNELQLREIGYRETLTRIEQYEMAYRMQTSVPELMDISSEPKHIHDLYGTQPGQSGLSSTTRFLPGDWSSVACGSCSYITGGGTATAPTRATTSSSRSPERRTDRPGLCSVDQGPEAARIARRDARRLGGEFGGTPMNEERNGSKILGRDHHPHAFTIWMAGGGIKSGITPARPTTSVITPSKTADTSTISRPRSCTVWA